MTENLATLINKRGPIRRIGVIGMGYVGIPAAALFADVPHFEHVYGFQRDSASSGYKINMLNRGESPLKGEEPGLEELLGRSSARGSSPAPRISRRSRSATR
jgi:UDP-N-acetyl-D-mannosaminuronic acid dehydrogenase